MSSLALISVALSGLPWLFPSLVGLAAGIGVHFVWFGVCEWLAPAGNPAAAGPAGRKAPAAVSAATPARAAQKPRRPAGFVPAPVLAVFDDAPDIRTFRFARPEAFEFKAGQFLTVRVRVDGKDVVRCYSISSSPLTPGYLEISVKRQGLVSNTLHATLRPGSTVSLRAPAGVFTYPDGDDRPLLLLAGGIGITPLLSMLRHAAAAEPARPVALLYSARREDAFAFRRELATLAERHPQVRVVLAASSGSTSPEIYPGRIDETLIRTTVPDVAGAVAMICGPQPMIDAMRAMLLQIGLPESQIRSEMFEAAVAAAGGKHEEPAAADSGAPHTMTCTLAGQAVSSRAGPDDPRGRRVGGRGHRLALPIRRLRDVPHEGARRSGRLRVGRAR